MQKIFSSLLVVVFLVQGLNTNAQQKLSIKDAIQIALKNSYDIKLVENTVAIAKNNNDYGVAGALPTVSATGNENKTSSTLQQQYADPTRNTTKSGVDGTTVSAGVSASLILFNGYRVQTTKERLAALESQSNSFLNTQIQNTTATVMQQYYNILRQQVYLGTIQKSIEASQQRLDIIKEKQKVGVANEADLLQSNLDLNALVQAKENQILVIDAAKEDLLNSLILPTNTKISLTDSIIVDTKLVLSDIESKSAQNPSLISIQQQIKINQLIEKETRALMYPTLRANTGYNFSSNKSAAGFSLLNETYGPSLGVTLSVPLYAGGASKKSYKNAIINTSSANIQYQNAIADMATSVTKTYQSYKTSVNQLGTEAENYQMSQALLNLVMQKFQLGSATIVDVKQAQQSFENAGFRLVSLVYTAKIAEVELKRLSNQLAF
jgi:outer membrane protein TolC